MIKIMKTGLIAGLLITVLVFFGGCFPAADSEEGSGSIWPMIVFLVVIFALFYFVMIRPQRKRQKEHQTLMEGLQKGDRVITAGGIYGTIESLSEESVVIKVEGGTTMRVARGSVAVQREK